MSMSDWMKPDLKHRDGVAWHDANRPFPLHKCRVRTDGWIGLTQVQRCACGGMRTNHSVRPRWHDKNQRWGKFVSVLTAILALALPVLLVAGLVAGLAMAGFQIAAFIIECIAIAAVAFIIGQRITA